jgi:predicted ester cyclase
MKKFLTLAVVVLALYSCNDKPAEATVKSATDVPADPAINKEKMEQRNKEVIMASMEGINSHNADAVLKYAAPNSIDYGDGSDKPCSNVDSIKMMMTSWMNAFPDVKAEKLTYVADGDMVMVYGWWSGTFKKDFMGMKATNKPYKMYDVDIFKMTDDGKVLEHRNTVPFSVMMEQVGAKMH